MKYGLLAFVFVLGGLAGPAQGKVTDLARLQMGEGIDGQPRELIAQGAEGPLKLQAVGRPRITDSIGQKTNEATGSTAAIELDADSGFKVNGLPINPKDNFGIEAWVKPTGNRGFRSIVNYGGSGGLGLALQGDGAWGMMFGKGSIGFKKVEPDKWVHLAVVVENGKGRFFVNGRGAGQNPDARSWGYPLKRAMSIGVPVLKQNKGFEGAIDEVRVFTFKPGEFETNDLLYYQKPPGQEFSGEVAEIIFTKQPQENGITFDRTGMKYAKAEGKDAWMSTKTQLAQMVWLKDLNLTFTDENFRNGNMPVVDVEAVVRLNTWAGITGYADTDRGSARGGMTWGASPNWRTLRFRLDDAYFGGRDHNSPDNELQSDGYDLRLFGANEPLYVHRVTVRGYARTGNIDWRRMTKAERPRGIDTHMGSEILMYPSGSQARLRLPVANLALEDNDVRYTFRVIDEDDNVLAERADNITLVADQTTDIELTFDTAGWPYGAHRYEYRLERPAANLRLATIDGHLGVYAGGQLAKAADGEFMFGLQHTGDPLEDRNAAWLDLLGVDILRGGLKTHTQINTSRKTTDQTYAELFRRGYRVMAMMDPPKPGSPTQYDEDGMDPKKRASELAKKTQFLEKFARDYAGKITYYELGNEPDLPFFYPGPVEEYVDSFKQMRAAIKKADPNAVVMTGGLCFHGEDGDRRARQIIDLLGPDGVDAWSYHSHGPGYEAQRKGWERQYEATKKVGAEHLTFIDTETGMAASGEAQLREQARTAIEKFVYTMSKGSPATFFFALHFKEGSGGYTMVERYREPRPVVMSYRNLVSMLRGAEFVSTVEGASSSLRVFRFADARTGRQTIVGWSQADHASPLRFGVNARDGQAETVDMFGNRTPVNASNGDVEIAVGPDPVFVTWIDPDAIGQDVDENSLAVLPSLIEAVGPVRAAAGEPASVDVLVRRPTTSTGDLSLISRLVIDDATAGEWSWPVDFGGQDSAEVRVTVEVPGSYAMPSWPSSWRVFAKYPHNNAIREIDGQALIDLPNSLTGIDGTWATMTDTALDLEKAAGSSEQKATGVAMSRVWAAQDMTVRVGAAADWWMAWWANGQPVYDTLKRGNKAGLLPTAHTFDMPLKAGWNTVATQVIAGVDGWKVIAAGPARLSTMLHPELPPNRLELILTQDGGQTLGSSNLPVFPMPAVAPGAGSDTATHPPLITLDTADVTNFHEAHPDSKRWYGGLNDLSGRLWMFHVGGNVQAVVEVIDDEHTTDGDQVSLTLTSVRGGEPLMVPLAAEGKTRGNTTRYVGSTPLPAGFKSSLVTLTLEDTDRVMAETKQQAKRGMLVMFPNAQASEPN